MIHFGQVPWYLVTHASLHIMKKRSETYAVCYKNAIWVTRAGNLAHSVKSRLISFIGYPRWHKYGTSAFAYVTTKCADYYREVEESEVPNYPRSSPRDTFFSSAPFFQNETCGESCLRDHLDQISEVFKDVTVYQSTLNRLIKAANKLLRFARGSVKNAIVSPVEGIADEYWFIAWEYAMCQMLCWYICAIC